MELAGPRSDYIIITYDSQTAASKVQGTGPVNKYGGLVGVTTTAAKTLWEFGLAGACIATVSASRHRST
eukprot:COSAG01_NODE_26750_length_704_cov_1.173554_1_plen_68_part_01